MGLSGLIWTLSGLNWALCEFNQALSGLYWALGGLIWALSVLKLTILPNYPSFILSLTYELFTSPGSFWFWLP